MCDKIEAKVHFGTTHLFSLRAAKSHFESETNFGKASDKMEAKVKFDTTHCFSLRAMKKPF
jgi:hypothetical protein